MQILSNARGAASTIRRLILVPVLLAACSHPATTPVATFPTPAAGAQPALPPLVAGRDTGDCGPCCNRNPAAEASATQGVSPANPTNPYVGKDAYDNVIVLEGAVFYALTPGKPGFAVGEQTLRDAGGSLERYYSLVQVTLDPGKDAAGAPRKLRDKVQAYRASEPFCAARGTAQANPQFGNGGGVQYYVSPSDSARLVPGKITPISHWRVGTQGE